MYGAAVCQPFIEQRVVIFVLLGSDTRIASLFKCDISYLWRVARSLCNCRASCSPSTGTGGEVYFLVPIIGTWQLPAGSATTLLLIIP